MQRRLHKVQIITFLEIQTRNEFILMIKFIQKSEAFSDTPAYWKNFFT